MTSDAPSEWLTSRRIFVRGLRMDIEIGVHLHEHGRLQPLLLDVDLELEPGPVRFLADTVNYETVVENARAIAAQGHIMLVETFADALARACLQEPRVLSVRVRVEKPEALSEAQAAGVEVVMERG